MKQKIQKFLRAIVRNLVAGVGCLILLVSGAVTGAIILSSWRHLPQIELAVVGPAILGMLLGAFIIQLGPALLARVKKVGPVELYAEEVSQVLPELVHMLERVTRVDKGRPLVDVRDEPFEFTDDENYFNRKAEALIDYLEFSTTGSEPLRDSRDVHRLISRVAGIALEQREHARAIDRLEFLVTVSEGQYEPEESWTRLAIARNLLAVDLPARLDDRRLELHDRAIEAAQRAIAAQKKSGKHDFRPFYQRGLGHHELSEYSAAIKYYRLALEAEPTHAPSRYNMTAALSWRGELEAAVEIFDSMSVKDLDIGRVLDQEPDKDPDLARLLEDSVSGSRFRQKLSELRESRKE